MKDVAKAAGVSMMTVSRAFKTDASVSSATRDQIRQVAEDLRQGFVAVQGAEQVGDVQVEGLAVLRGQFFLVIAFGQVMQGPQ